MENLWKKEVDHRSSPSELFFRKGILKTCSKYTREHLFIRTPLDDCFYRPIFEDSGSTYPLQIWKTLDYVYALFSRILTGPLEKSQEKGSLVSGMSRFINQYIHWYIKSYNFHWREEWVNIIGYLCLKLRIWLDPFALLNTMQFQRQ